MQFEHINTKTFEGRMLYAALAKITSESQKDKTPYQVMDQINELMVQMDFSGKLQPSVLEVLTGFNGSDFVAEGDEIEPLHRRGTIGWFKLGEMMPSIPAFIHARHQHAKGWKYDLNIAVWLVDCYHVTRIYNIEEKFVRKEQ